VVPRAYRLGRRQPAVDATARAILAAARELVREIPGGEVGVADIARRAGVSRITVYNRFGSRQGVLAELAARPPDAAPLEGDPTDALRLHLAVACSRWAADPTLFRNLPHSEANDRPRQLAERLAAADQLRPGCSLREAEDVIAALSSFAVFDRLHHDGRRPAPAVAEVLMRLAAGILA
jgi:AcrR family transcriptional regulator